MSIAEGQLTLLRKTTWIDWQKSKRQLEASCELPRTLRRPIFSVIARLVAWMILFFMIALQCFSTVAVSKAESGGWKLLEAGRGPTRALNRDRLRADGGPGPGPAGPGRPVIPRFSFLPPAPEPIFGSESRGRRHYP